MLYNRASCDEQGNPVNPDKKIVWWNATKKVWEGYDRPDIGSLTAGLDTPAGQKPFRMVGEGGGRIFAARKIRRRFIGRARSGKKIFICVGSRHK